MKINNLPQYVDDYEFIVAREVDGEYWFYGAFHDRDRANEIAEKIHGIVTEVEHE